MVEEGVGGCRQEAEALRRKYSEIEGIIKERKRNRAELLDKTLSGTTVLSSELEKLAILSNEENKSKFVSSLARKGQRGVRGESPFNLTEILSTRQRDFERKQESQAFHIAKLRGQQANAKSSLRDFRQEHSGTAGAVDEGGEGDEAPLRPSLVLKKLERSWIGDNFRLRCLRSKVEAAKSVLEDRVQSERATPSRSLEGHDHKDVHVSSSILEEILDSSIEEGEKRRALLLRRRQGGDPDGGAGRDKMIRIIWNEYLAEVVRDMSREIWTEIESSYKEVKYFACQLVTNALVSPDSVSEMEPFDEKDSRKITLRKVRNSLSSVLHGMSEQSEVSKAFAGSSLFQEFLRGSSDAVGRRRPIKLNLGNLGRLQPSKELNRFEGIEEEYWTRVSLGSSSVNIQMESKGEVSCICCSYDGSYLAAGSSAGELFVWNLRANSELVLYSASAKRKKKRTKAVVSLCWSYNNLQVSVLFSDRSLAIYSLKATSRQAMESAEDGGKDQYRIAAISSSQLSKTSRSLSSGSAAEYSAAMKISHAFHPSFTITGFYPCLIVPSSCGDVNMITVERGGLLDFKRETGSNASPLNEQTMAFLSRPKVACESDVKQVICHGHSAPVVFAGYSWDTSNLVTVDAAGQISMWSCSQTKRTGFGWYVPDQTWEANLSLSVLKAVERTVLNSGKTEEEGDEEDHESKIASMRKWMTSYKYVGSKKNVDAVQQVIHIPEGPAKGSSDVYISDFAQNRLRARVQIKASWVKASFEVCCASFTSQDQELVLMSRRKTTAGTIDEDEGEEGEEDEMVQDHFSIFLVCLKTGKLKTPRVNVAIHEDMKPPAYVLSKTVSVLGSDYLYIGLGCNHIGVFSFATGVMVKDIELDLPLSVSILECSLADAADSSSADLLCCRCYSPATKTKLYFFEIADQAALEHSLAEQRTTLESGGGRNEELVAGEGGEETSSEEESETEETGETEEKEEGEADDAKAEEEESEEETEEGESSGEGETDTDE
ncbi:hypothetical protein HOP50_02g16900 [Chloropicon primus]|uniref:Regulator of MON1-CCZ1 complex N-terminal domain-containing protein n=2 Tax=Chloropicon primus TaxID=1764295 RepID=A0A5B8MFC6_9CHLO|nr:hypothetical protein A3770_02p16940 [Chloropicon primus]UPQ98384.1 hypothetical protein HOP50_02g16900 [Chloropicon primus]|eukprot:QDZ19176.1 hypothetical protein A3770_02p16940 [Chloropicon primus]